MRSDKTVLTLGFFDGIHIGHAQLLQMALQRASELSAKPAVMTFDSHPDTLVKKEKVPLINSESDKVYIIREFFGIDTVFFLHFNSETMSMNWRDFLDYIIKQYNCCHLVVGEDCTFGARGEGNAKMLLRYCEETTLGCDIIPQVLDGGVPVSSTRIRALIQNGEIEEANRLLGHPHLLTGVVRTGHRLGRTMNAPTVNMVLSDGVLVPKKGVYIAKVLIHGQKRQAVLNIGTRPTFNGEHITVETHILDFAGYLYGERICVELHSYIRPEIKFSSVEDLMLQIKKDVQTARSFFVSQ